jgi:hypothetical protein
MHEGKAGDMILVSGVFGNYVNPYNNQGIIIISFIFTRKESQSILF